MLKKFLIVLLILLTACSKKAEETITDQYVVPVRDVFLFGELDADSKVAISKANGNKDFSNYQFKMLGKDIYQNTLIDINGNSINLKEYSKVVVEVVSVECEHCRKLIKNHLLEMLEHDIPVVQYFNIGKAESIMDFYNELGIAIPEDLIVIASDAQMHDYVKEDLGLQTYPTLLSYFDGKLSFVATGEFEDIGLDDFYEISFNNQLTDLIDKEGNDLLSLLRDVDDVKASISISNQEKLAKLDNDQSTIDATYKVMGSVCDFEKISNDKSNIYMNEIDDFSIYKDKDLVLFYTYLRGDEKDEERVSFLNSLMKNNNYEYIVVLVEGLEGSSNFYKQMTNKFDCPCVSVLGYIPEDLYKIGIAAYPSAFFIRKGTYTGAYSNIESVDKFNEALDLFLSDNCIALLRNN